MHKSGLLARLAGTALVLAICGCGSDYKMAPVRGRVTCEGQPVPGGQVVFSPIAEAGETEPGKGAMALVDENGNYVLSTYDKHDGAIIGRHRIGFIIPEVETGELPRGLEAESRAEMEAEREAASRLAKMPNCRVPKESEVTVVAGENVIDIELVRGAREEDDD